MQWACRKDSLTTPTRIIAYPDLGQLLQVSVQQSNCDHIGLLLARQIRLADMGLAGQIARCGETVGEGLQNFIKFFALHNSAATVSVFTPRAASRVSCMRSPNPTWPTRGNCSWAQ